MRQVEVKVGAASKVRFHSATNFIFILRVIKTKTQQKQAAEEAVVEVGWEAAAAVVAEAAAAVVAEAAAAVVAEAAAAVDCRFCRRLAVGGGGRRRRRSEKRTVVDDQDGGFARRKGGSVISWAKENFQILDFQVFQVFRNIYFEIYIINNLLSKISGKFAKRTDDYKLVDNLISLLEQ